MCFIEPEAAGLFRRQFLGAGAAGAALAAANLMLPGLAPGRGGGGEGRRAGRERGALQVVGTNGWEILPTHWDNFEKPFTEPAQDLRAVFGDPGNLDLWVKEAKRVSPKSKVVVLKFFESYAP